MSKRQKTVQREARQRGDTIRAASAAYSRGEADTISPELWRKHQAMLMSRRKQARKDGLKSAQELRAIAARLNGFKGNGKPAARGTGATEREANR